MDLVTILSRAAGVVAVAKPAGLATQAAAGVPSVEAWARRAIEETSAAGYLGIPHRLDRAVSGVLLLAVTPRAARKLSRQFERRQVRKTYLAVMAVSPAGLPALEAATEWQDRVVKVPDEPRGRIAGVDEEGREAITLVRQVAEIELGGESRAVVRLEPLTGRMHQLRLQAAARGMPIVGDSLYGGPPLPAGLAACTDLRAAPILLHAWKITYLDPDSGVPIEITAPLPDFWPAVAATAAG